MPHSNNFFWHVHGKRAIWKILISVNLMVEVWGGSHSLSSYKFRMFSLSLGCHSTDTQPCVQLWSLMWQIVAVIVVLFSFRKWDLGTLSCSSLPLSFSLLSPCLHLFAFMFSLSHRVQLPLLYVVMPPVYGQLIKQTLETDVYSQ